MRQNEKIDKKYLVNSFNENLWVRYVAYGVGGVIGIWILGKAANLITDAVVNFKKLNNVIKQ